MQIGHPSLRRLYEYWDEKRSDRIAPARADIDPVDIPDILPNMFIYRVEHDPRDYLMLLFGTALVDAFGRDLTHRRFDEIFSGSDYAAMRAEYDAAVDECRPICVSHDGNWIDRDHVEYTRLLLPLSEDGKTVDRLMGASYFKGERPED